MCLEARLLNILRLTTRGKLVTGEISIEIDFELKLFAQLKPTFRQILCLANIETEIAREYGDSKKTHIKNR